jgi:FkbM family methyltransferase
MFSDYGPVHTFEPLLFNVLEENIKNNNIIHSITIYKYGLSSRDSQEFIYLPKCRNGLFNYGACSIKPDFESSHSTEGVIIDLKKLDDVYTGIPSLMKIDVEGYELEVLEGAIEILKKHKPALIVEIHDIKSSLIPSFLIYNGYTQIRTRPHDNYFFI